MPADIRIKIGVSVDASTAAVMAPIEQAAKRVGKTIENELKAANRKAVDETVRGTKKQASTWEKLEREVEKMADKMLADETKAQKKAAAMVDREEKQKTASVRREAKERAKSEREAMREIERMKKAEAKRSAEPWYNRGLLGTPGRGAPSGYIGLGYRSSFRVGRGVAMAYGLGGQALSTASGIGRDVLQGIGVDTSLSSLIHQATNQQSLATKLSNAGYVPGTKLIDPNTLLGEARGIGTKTGTDSTEVLEAMRAFVAKTGDLQTARDTMGQMAMLSKATGTSLESMADAAAEVTNNLHGVDDKAAVTNEIMKQIAGQGKLGAVEIRDLATQMAKLASASSAFKGGAVANIRMLGVLAQESKLGGGSASATQAATSVMRFASDLTKRTTLKNWATFKDKEGAGLTPFADKSHTMLSDPKSIIMAALRASQGSIDKLNLLFPNQMSMRAVRGFANIYNTTSGSGEDKLAAVEAEFKRLTDAALSQEEVTRAFNAQMKTTESKVTVFNNKMIELAEKLAAIVIPAFEQLAPSVLSVSNAMIDALAALGIIKKGPTNADFDASHPGQAAADIANIQNTATFGAGGTGTVGPFKGTTGPGLVPEYSQEAISVAQAHVEARAKTIAAFKAKVEADRKAAYETEGLQQYATPSAVVPGAKLSKEATQEQRAAQTQLDLDARALDQLTKDQGDATKYLSQILDAIRTGNAMQTSAPAPQVTTPAEAEK